MNRRRHYDPHRERRKVLIVLVPIAVIISVTVLYIRDTHVSAESGIGLAAIWKLMVDIFREKE